MGSKADNKQNARNGDEEEVASRTSDGGHDEQTGSKDNAVQGEEDSVEASVEEDLALTQKTSNVAAKDPGGTEASHPNALDEAAAEDVGDNGSPSSGTRSKSTKHESKHKSPDKAHHHHHHHHHHHKLNERTLQRLKSYLQSDKMNESLDEDAIAVRILKTDKVTSERVRFLHDPLVDSDEEEDNDATQQQIYQAAEDYTLALDFYKKVVADTQAEKPNSALDKRTLNWLRKAMGLQRRSGTWETSGPQAEQSDEESDDEEGKKPKSKGPKPTRVTRGMARSTRIRKREIRATRENIGLGALVSAVSELEEDMGPFTKVSTLRLLPACSFYQSLLLMTFHCYCLRKKRKRPPSKSRARGKDVSDAENQEPRSKKPKPSGKKSPVPPAPVPARAPAPLPVKEDFLKRDLIALLPERQGEKSKSGRPIRRVKQPDKPVKVRVIVGGRDIRHAPPKIPKPQVKPQVKPIAQPSKKRKQPQQRISPPPEDEEERQRRRELRRMKRKKLLAIEKENEGKLFSAIDPFGAITMDSTNYIADSSHISLSLLEWKRRQQWDLKSNKAKASSHETYEEGMHSVPPKLAASGISAALPTWDSVNPIPEIQRQPTTTDPPRRRHSDATYAEWISKLINCLKGSGRSWAFYEFFYSDLDRAWYNFNDFQVEVAKLGVPPNAKLTRKEWSLVRRSIRGRPRRFSNKFIRSEMMKLREYRNSARRIQANPHENTGNLGYDVPAYIRVGATVTAYHSKFRVLHRGTVVAHDVTRNGYLVQFERPELGYQFCPDTEIASHGVPEILVPTADRAIDGTALGSFGNRYDDPGSLPYGTSYGPMFVDHVIDPVAREGQARNALLDIVSGTSTDSPGLDSKDISDEELMLSPDNKPALVERVAERETVVLLVGTIDAALKRKSVILDAMDKCHEQAETTRNSRAYKDHYSWLHANLRMTNQSLESSLLLLQAMYSNAYTGMRTSEIEQEKYLAAKAKLRQLVESDEVSTDLSAPWFLAMSHGTQRVGSLVASSLTEQSINAAASEEE